MIAKMSGQTWQKGISSGIASFSKEISREENKKHA